jgi:hypothetical protein
MLDQGQNQGGGEFRERGTGDGGAGGDLDEGALHAGRRDQGDNDVGVARPEIGGGTM